MGSTIQPSLLVDTSHSCWSSAVANFPLSTFALVEEISGLMQRAVLTQHCLQVLCRPSLVSVGPFLGGRKVGERAEWRREKGGVAWGEGTPVPGPCVPQTLAPQTPIPGSCSPVHAMAGHLELCLLNFCLLACQLLHKLELWLKVN